MDREINQNPMDTVQTVRMPTATENEPVPLREIPKAFVSEVIEVFAGK